MTHLAVIAPPLPGHYDPLRVLARRLEARGHRITFVHMADAAALADGFGFAAVGGATHGQGALADYRAILARAPTMRGFFRMIEATAAMSAMLLDDLPDALARLGVDAVLADEAEPAGAMVARYLRLPFVTTVTGLPLMREPGVPPPFVPWPFRNGRIGRIRNAGGYWVADALLGPIRRVLEPRGAQWDVPTAGGSPLLTVAQCPQALDFPRAALPSTFHYGGPWRGESAAVALPEDERPLVYCSLGSLQGDRPDLFAAMTAACAARGARAVVAHGGLLSDADARALPGDPIVGAYWPQQAVLPRCRAAILHGGFNTVLDALAAGVPMVVAPLAFEQPGTAARVARTGAGVMVRGRLGRGRIERALGRVLEEDGFRAAAERMAAQMAQVDGAEGAAALIDQALSAARP